MSPLGLGSDVAISVRGPAAHTGIVALKATHGRIPATGHWPEVPRRFWHVGPMARTVRDITLAYSLLAGPDGIDGYATSPIELTAASSPSQRTSFESAGWSNRASDRSRLMSRRPLPRRQRRSQTLVFRSSPFASRPWRNTVASTFITNCPSSKQSLSWRG
jgi:hypothetical protein